MLGIVSNQYGSRTTCQTCTKYYSQSTKSLPSITRALQHTATMLRSKANPTRIGGFHTHPWFDTTYDSAPAPAPAAPAPAAAAPAPAAAAPVAAPVPAPGADEDELTGGGGGKKTKVATKKKKPPTKSTCCKAKKPKTKPNPKKKKKKSLGTMEGKYGKHFIRNLFDASL